MFRKASLFTIVLILVSVPALAQSVEITPTLGLRFGGDLDDTGNAELRGTASLDDSETHGVIGDFITREGWGLELLLSVQSTDLDLSNSLMADGHFSAKTTTFHLGGIYHFRYGTSFQPFAVGTFGTTQLKASGQTQNGLSYAAGGGVKFYFGEHFGARLQGSVLNSHFEEDDTLVCSKDTCFGLIQRNNVTQFEATAGFIFRF
jgi:hypothetical protein